MSLTATVVGPDPKVQKALEDVLRIMGFDIEGKPEPAKEEKCEGHCGCDAQDEDEDDETQLDFSEALDLLKDGKKLSREGWNGAGQHVGLDEGDDDDHLPFLYIRTVQGKYVPWLASQTDLLAEDWYVL